MTESEPPSTQPKLTQLAHQAVASVVTSGSVVVDATAGNGHDTLFLAQRVGPTGRVFSFDVQREALRKTVERVTFAGLSNVTAVNRCHSEMEQAVRSAFAGDVQATMFNLGYLPGSDKTLITGAASTLAAIEGALNLLTSGGAATILAYRGHPGGIEEALAVSAFLGRLDPGSYDISRHVSTNAAHNPTAPELFIVRKRLIF